MPRARNQDARPGTTIRRGSPRALLVYRAAEGCPGKRTLTGSTHTKECGCKIEVLGKGQQFVAFGRHASGADLEWYPAAPGDMPFDALTSVTEAQITSFLEACAPIIDAPPPPKANGLDPEPIFSGEPQANSLRIAAALAAIPNHGPADWEAWNRVGMAVWRATGGSSAGWEAFNAWSRRNQAYDADATRKRWDHYTTSPPTSIGAGTIFHMASEASGRPFVDPDDPGPTEPRTGESPPRGTAYGRLRVLSVDDIDTAALRDYLLKGLLSPGEISIWVGAPKCGKSFLLLYVAYMLSLGRSVFGRRVKPTKVLYVAAEGEAGIAKRIRALRNKYGRSENFTFIAQPIDLLRNGGHKLEVIDAATAVHAQLIVIDTLNRAMAGGDENSPEDMGTFVGNVSDIKHQTKTHVAVIHHGTKASNGSRPRGHGSLEGADDALIEVQKLQDGSRVATVVHAKDDADGMRWGFALDMVELGTDDDGDAITTMIVREMTEVPEKATRAPPLSNNEQIALACFDKAMKAEGMVATVGDNHEERPVLQELAFRRRYYTEAKPGENQETKRQAFKRAVEGLLAKGRLACRDDLFWRPDTW